MNKILTLILMAAIIAMPFASIPALPAMADISTPDNGIWLQTTGSQAWAYYPYPGGQWSAVNTGTSYFTVKPGMSILRKIIVQNKLSYNTSVHLSVSGLPVSWTVSLLSSTPVILSGYMLVNGTWIARPTGKGASLSPQGFANLIVTVPANAAPGTYPYTITASTYNATYGKYFTSTLTDSIVVGTSAPGPTPTATPVPSTTPTITPSPSPSPSASPKPGQYGVNMTHRWASYNGTFKPIEQFKVSPGTTAAQSVYYKNTGTASDSYTISVSGIPSTWYTIVSYGTATVSPGGSRYANVFIKPAAGGNYTLTITVTSNSNPAVSAHQTYTLYTGVPMTPTPTPSPAPRALALANPGFENGLQGWRDGSFDDGQHNGGWVEISNDSHSGKYSAHLMMGNGSDWFNQYSWWSLIYQPNNLSAGDNVTVTLWYKGSGFLLLFGTDDFMHYPPDPLSISVPPSSNWTKYTATWNYTSENGGMGPVLGIMYGENTYVDDISATVTGP